MGVKGRRSRNIADEPNLLIDVNSIIAVAIEKGFIDGYEVDIEAIIESNDEIILIKDTNMESSVSGSLSKNKDQNKWEIKVNAKHHPKRQRFTMAHEFAHFILHKDDKGTFVDEEVYFRKSNDSPIEFNADKFASELLMPEALFTKAIREDGIKKINELSNLFNVSSMAIELRAKSLNFKTKSNEK